MISLRRLNGTQFHINAELIETLEASPDTVVSLVTGNRFVVLESVQEVIEKILQYRVRVNAERKVINPMEGYKRAGA
ncbi:MAG: flagellar FlbD family protein [Elusimicrobia bacterium]|nr:flagellar FlbD family protein [Elusimicrobiota bacterium]